MSELNGVLTHGPFISSFGFQDLRPDGRCQIMPQRKLGPEQLAEYLIIGNCNHCFVDGVEFWDHNWCRACSMHYTGLTYYDGVCPNCNHDPDA